MGAALAFVSPSLGARQENVRDLRTKLVWRIRERDARGGPRQIPVSVDRPRAGDALYRQLPRQHPELHGADEQPLVGTSLLYGNEPVPSKDQEGSGIGVLPIDKPLGHPSLGAHGFDRLQTGRQSTIYFQTQHTHHVPPAENCLGPREANNI